MQMLDFSALRPVKIIARLTLREVVRRRMVLAAGLLGLAFLLIYNLGFFFLYRDIRASGGLGPTLARNEFFNFISMAGMYAVNFLGIVMAALIAADTLAGEIGTGTIQAVVTKPLRRAEVVLGKWLGFVILLTLYLTLMGGGVFVSLWAQAGYQAPHVLTGLALWKRAANEMTTPLVRELGFSPFTSNSVPSVAMIVYAGFYLAAALWFAIRRFRARDL